MNCQNGIQYPKTCFQPNWLDMYCAHVLQPSSLDLARLTCPFEAVTHGSPCPKPALVCLHHVNFDINTIFKFHLVWSHDYSCPRSLAWKRKPCWSRKQLIVEIHCYDCHVSRHSSQFFHHFLTHFAQLQCRHPFQILSLVSWTNLEDFKGHCAMKGHPTSRFFDISRSTTLTRN